MGRITKFFFIGIAIIVLCCCGTINHVDAAHQGLAFIQYSRSKVNNVNTKNMHFALLIPRGGEIDDSEYDESEYDTDDESEEEEINVTKSLKSSAMKASTKARKQKTTSTKKVVNASLSKKKKSSKTGVTAVKKKKSLLRIPYILKAFLNPFTVFAMTKGYFASLFNIDYLQEDTSQTLRSALQEKAKKQSGSDGKRPGRGRKMKPGQAKTLSDLPQLNA